MASFAFTMFQRLFVVLAFAILYPEFNNSNVAVYGEPLKIRHELKNLTVGNLKCKGDEYYSFDNNTVLCKPNVTPEVTDMKYDIPKGEARIFKRSILNSTNVTNSPAIERVSPNDSTMSDPTNFTSQIGTTTTAADYPTTTNNPHTKANHSYIVGILAVCLGIVIFSICIYCVYIRLKNPAVYYPELRDNAMELATIRPPLSGI